MRTLIAAAAALALLSAGLAMSTGAMAGAGGVAAVKRSSHADSTAGKKKPAITEFSSSSARRYHPSR